MGDKEIRLFRNHLYDSFTEDSGCARRFRLLNEDSSIPKLTVHRQGKNKDSKGKGSKENAVKKASKKAAVKKRRGKAKDSSVASSSEEEEEVRE
jgi:hypothetical protein